MKMLVGLGNPGREYENTRHNIGFMLVDEFVKKHNASFDKTKFNAEYAMFYVDGIKYLVIKPLTYMNLSGEAVRKFYDYFDLEIEDILVVYDDLDTKTSNFRLRQTGSSGGHNGIKSIISHLGTDKFYRLKIGIDRPKNGMKVTDYVLGRFSKEEMDEMLNVYPKCLNCFADFSKMDFINLMNKYN